MRYVRLIVAAMLWLGLSPAILCSADEPITTVTLTLDAPVVNHGDKLGGKVVLTPAPAADTKIQLRWTDSFNRLVAQIELPAAAGATEVKFTLPTDADLTMANRLQASLVLPAPAVPAPAPAAPAPSVVEFIVTPAYSPWDDYQTIMYYAYNENQQDRLRDIGINAGMNQARSRILDATNQKTRIWWGHDYRYYCEQILSDVYAEY
ncbi:MAG TPA: hypothetical protein VL860_00360, partial [Planctomycetota bacterium]|nr:hypothetical protein [Planctomycetota bacterium]